MDNRSLARVALNLLRGGVAPRHVRRCIEELRSHRADLIDQLKSQGLDQAAAVTEAEARLGNPTDFVAATLARAELRGWASRVPWLVFVVVPVLALAALGMMAMALVVGYLQIAEPSTQPIVNVAAWRTSATLLTVMVQWTIPLVIYASLFAIGWRSRSRPAWAAAGMMLVSVLAGVLTVQLVAPVVGEKGQLSVGAGYPPPDLARAGLHIAAAGAFAVAIFVRDRIDRALLLQE